MIKSPDTIGSTLTDSARAAIAKLVAEAPPISLENRTRLARMLTEPDGQMRQAS